ncbi:MAG: DNA-deoxyinosine glycosylase [Bacilli bacterium]|nr:DNA-deoxyinosine glycosylase [Bacilli bacterium]
MKITHPLRPIYNEESKILILGSFPSVKSRENNFYYAHPQNQFWSIMCDLFNETITDKEKFLLDKHIALFDVIKSCDIKGSADQSIKNVKVNDIKTILNKTQIKYIFTTGKKATNLYIKYLEKQTGIKPFYLPSTSPLFSKMKYEEKLEEYKKILYYLDFKQ